MRDHARAQALAHLRQNPKEQAVHGNDDGRSPALINMPRAKHHRGEQDPRRHVTGPRAKLFLEISAENNFFANAGRNGGEDPKKYFQTALREHKTYGLASLGGVERMRSRKKNDNGDEPETGGDGDVL